MYSKIAVCISFLGLQLTAHDQASSAKLNLIVVEGEGAINNLSQRVAREPIVQVEDENRKPVAGAAVTFILPDGGASGVFLDGSRTLITVTDQSGRAIARGLQANRLAGKFQIRVSASFQGQVGSTVIQQVNAIAAAAGAAGGAAGAGTGAGATAGGAVAAAGIGKIVAIVAIVAGAAVGGGLAAASKGGGGSSPAATIPGASQSTIIVPGSLVVGPPK